MKIYVFCRDILRAIFTLLYRFEAVGTENIPKEGGVLLCSNHKSLLDPISVGIKVKRQVKFMAKEELFKVPVLGWLITQFGAFPVKRGGVSKESFKTSISILRGGEIMGIFPVGTRFSDTGAAKKGAAMFALRGNAAVVPAAIIGDYKIFRKMKIVYGQPIALDDLKSGEVDGDPLELVTERIMDRIHEMEKTGRPSGN